PSHLQCVVRPPCRLESVGICPRTKYRYHKNPKGRARQGDGWERPNLPHPDEDEQHHPVLGAFPAAHLPLRVEQHPDPADRAHDRNDQEHGHDCQHSPTDTRPSHAPHFHLPLSLVVGGGCKSNPSAEVAELLVRSGLTSIRLPTAFVFHLQTFH